MVSGWHPAGVGVGVDGAVAGATGVVGVDEGLKHAPPSTTSEGGRLDAGTLSGYVPGGQFTGAVGVDVVDVDAELLAGCADGAGARAGTHFAVGTSDSCTWCRGQDVERGLRAGRVEATLLT